MPKAYFIVNDSNRRYIAEQVAKAAVGDVVVVREPTRSLEQNARIHASLTEVGKLLGWKFNGQSVDIEDLKSIFMAAYRKASGAEVRFALGIDGQPVILNWRTRDLTKKECSEFIEMLNAWMAEKEEAA